MFGIILELFKVPVPGMPFTFLDFFIFTNVAGLLAWFIKRLFIGSHNDKGE